MSTSSTRIRTGLLRLTVLLYCWLQTHHSVFAANVTVLHTDLAITYSPQESWLPNSDLCSTCLEPAISISYHEGINTALGVVSTTSSSASTASLSPSSIVTPTALLSSSSTTIPFSSSSSIVTPTASPTLSTASLPSSLPAQTSNPPNLPLTTASSSPTIPFSSSGLSTMQHGRGSSHNDLDAIVRPRLDLDIPVTLSYNFTGTAIYMFCIQPLGDVTTIGGTLTNTNLTFTLDNQPVGNFSYPGTPGSTGFVLNRNILSLDGLSDQPHQLVVTVGDNSVFLFNHLIYTDNSVEDSTSSATVSILTNIAFLRRDVKKHDIATFAGALGGSVGVLSLFSLGLAISIIRRRMLAARRDRRDDEANAANNPTSMSGPMPFVPRYFPDTVIPQDPPTYNDALSSTNHNNTPLLASLSSSGYASRQRSYADIPPASPPPPLEELPPPPPFPVALSVDLPTGVISSSTSTEIQTPASPDVPNNLTSSHEVTPLLESSDSDTRPRSRMSTRSLESSENPETDHHQEDDS